MDGRTYVCQQNGKHGLQSDYSFPNQQIQHNWIKPIHEQLFAFSMKTWINQSLQSSEQLIRDRS